ncbi:MAG: sugar ABC transporter permease [Pseudomonadota bacterium]|nr:sugar ABC transporter permease [Pseudomonadota bacterium]
MTNRSSPYPYWFVLPASAVYITLFLVPTAASFWFCFTRWDLTSAQFIGLDNFRQFFAEHALLQGFFNTMIYALLTCGLKTVLGLLLAVYLTSNVLGQAVLRNVMFFPTLVSTIGVGFTFSALMHPTKGLFNVGLAAIGVDGPGWLVNPALALYSIAAVDLWKGVGLATLIYIAGLASIGGELYDAAEVDGASPWQTFWKITVPLVRPATITVITLSLIGGMRSFDVIWSMTRGGPGFSSDVLASVIYKQYQAGFYGLATAGNVMLFLLIAVVILPLTWWFNRREVEL